MLSSVYPISREKEDTYWYSAGMRKHMSRFCGRYVRGKILEIGCGTGGNIPLLKQYGQYYGVDINMDAVELARGRDYSLTITQGNVASLPYPDQFFDTVYCTDVLYHQWVNSPAVALQEIKRVLKSGGLFVVREAAYNWLRSRHDDAVMTGRRFTKQSLVRQLEKADFFVLEERYLNSFILPFAIAERLLHKWYQGDSAKGFMDTTPFDRLFVLLMTLERKLGIKMPFGLAVVAVAKTK
ncbi:MAG: class I SAM-dependent methyltransferase [bacterium]|nr:class I SAM-dependent methyltransferase [bacterium]